MKLGEMLCHPPPITHHPIPPRSTPSGPDIIKPTKQDVLVAGLLVDGRVGWVAWWIAG